ncbi:MAG: hypothetical protein AB1Z23_00370 [Eubacteriales bacterium]
MIAALKYMVQIHAENAKKIFQLAWSHAKMDTAGTTLGIGWVFIRDLANMFAMIAFRLLMSGSAEVEGVHFIVYLAAALIPWYFINDVIFIGVNSIRSMSAIVQGMYFPAVILPTINVYSIFVKRIASFSLLFIVIFIYGDISFFNPLLFLYYIVCMLIFVNVYSLFVSPVITLSRDFVNLYNTIVRVFFFITPIMWSYTRIAEFKVLVAILKINPMSYIVTGFRSAVTGGALPPWNETLAFWALTAIVFLFASRMQYKLRKYYADFI